MLKVVVHSRFLSRTEREATEYPTYIRVELMITLIISKFAHIIHSIGQVSRNHCELTPATSDQRDLFVLHVVKEIYLSVSTVKTLVFLVMIFNTKV